MSTNTLNTLAVEFNNYVREKGFWNEYDKALKMCDEHDYSRIMAIRNAFLCQKLMLTVTELSEAVEALRHQKRCSMNPDEMKTMLESGQTEKFISEFSSKIKDTFEDELADSLIRILDLSAELEIDMDFHVKAKMMYNLTRDEMHGRKKF